MCIAVGSSGNGSDATVALAERWNGAGWRILPLPRPTQSTTTALSGVWCTSAAACITVGRVSFRTGAHLTLAQLWNGKAWAIGRSANPVFDTGSSTLNGVSCMSAKACTAVGSYDNASGRQIPLAERWDGTVWTLQQVPVPAGAIEAHLNAVSCAGAAECIAVGSYTTGSPDGVTLAEAWNGTSWTVIPTPSGSALSGVSCPSTTACVVVGGWTAGFWNASGWTFTNALPGSPQPFQGLDGVSCTSAMTCTAVGNASASAVVDLWDGTSWNVQDTPNVPVPSPGGSWLAGVSCATATACAAVGGLSSYHIGGALVELWGGLSWTLNSPELPDVFDISQLNGVSCSSPTTCVVVGQSASQQVATTWDGAAWTIEHPPTPSGASITSLNGVSCTSTTACTAVGSYKRSPYTTMTTQLIEHEP